MPAKPHNPSKQPAGIQPAVSEHDHGVVSWDSRPEQTEQAQPVVPPLPFLPLGHNRPGDRDGAALVDHAHSQHGEAVVERGGVDGKRKRLTLPQSEHPGQQRGEAGGNVEGLAFLSGFGVGFVAPFAQALGDGCSLLPKQQGEEGGDGGTAAGAHHHDAVAPQRQADSLRLAELGKVD